MKTSLLILISSLSLCGCISSKSYLEPQYRGVEYSDIKVPEQPAAVRVTVIGQTNGKEKSKATDFWKRQVVHVLETSRVFRISDTAPATLTIIIDNVGDVGSAAGKGFMTGLTFGAVGSTVTDGYVMTVVYLPEKEPEFKGTYHHAIHTTIGNAKPPEGLSAVTLQEAPTMVAEDMVLHFLKDLEQQTTARADSPGLTPTSVVSPAK